MGGAIEVRPIVGVVAIARAGLPRRVGPRPRRADRLPRRLRPRRGGRPGGVRDRRRALAARRHPGNPGAWLVTTARNRAIDRIRRDRTLADEDQAARGAGGGGGRRWTTTTFPDERLELHLHLLPPGARARRAGRADAAHARRADDGRDRARVPRPRGDDGAAARARQAQDRGGRHPVPRAARRTCCPTGSRAVLAVVYLIFNEGYARPRRACALREAIRLGRALAELMPDEPEVARPARADAAARRPPRRPRSRDGELVLLARPGPLAAGTRDADRRRAAPRSTARSPCGGRGPVRRCRRRSPSLHADEPRDWPQIAALYGELGRLHRLAGRRAQPRRRRRRGRRPRGRRSAIARRARARPLPLPPLDPRRAAPPARAAPTRLASPTRAHSSSSTPSAERRFLERRLAALR